MQIKSINDISTIIEVSIKANNTKLTKFLIQSIIQQREKNDFSIELTKKSKPISSDDSDDDINDSHNSFKEKEEETSVLFQDLEYELKKILEKFISLGHYELAEKIVLLFLDNNINIDFNINSSKIIF